MERKEYISRSPSDTLEIGENLGRSAVVGEVYALCGDLGAGKTQLAKGIARGLGVPDWQYVVSPSFTLMNIYDGRCELCHVDLYRLDGAEAEMLLFEEYLERGIVVIEWAERVQLGDDVCRVRMEMGEEDERRIVVERP
jgi:tRNA threonylcarbamoyladenosine biosynthesis protein TsaE